MDRKIYFYLVYITFFFLAFLFYDLSVYLTPNPLPTPAFLLYTPLTKYIFLLVILIATPIIFAILYIATRKLYILVSIIVYIILFAIYLTSSIFTVFYNEIGGISVTFAYVALGFVTMALYIASVIGSEPYYKISKALWIISSFYLPVFIITSFFIPNISFYTLLLVLPSIVASGIEALKHIKTSNIS